MMMIPSHSRPSSGVALACVLALSAANNPSLVSAFVPSHRVGASSFVHRTTAATAPPAFSQNSAYAPGTSSSTVLHMNLFDRFTRVVNSNLNNVLKNLEDPEKIMTQALEDMQVRCRRCLTSL
jgi:PspA/IM30 family